MDENMEIMDPLPENKGDIAKWLKYLPYVRIAGLLVGFFVLIPGLSGASGLLLSAISAGSIYLLFQLAPSCGRYRTAAIAYSVCLVISLLGLEILSLVGSVASLVAVYQEFNGHSDITKHLDAYLANQWHSLFYWSMLAGLLGGVVGVSGVVIGVLAGVENQTLVNLIVPLVGVVELVIELVYLSYMKKTVKLFET